VSSGLIATTNTSPVVRMPLFTWLLLGTGRRNATSTAPWETAIQARQTL
jgi:hypothetical protein